MNNLKKINADFKAETEFMIQLNDIASDYVLSVRGKTSPDLADFLMVLQSQVDADFHEAKYNERV